MYSVVPIVTVTSCPSSIPEVVPVISKACELSTKFIYPSEISSKIIVPLVKSVSISEIVVVSLVFPTVSSIVTFTSISPVTGSTTTLSVGTSIVISFPVVGKSLAFITYSIAGEVPVSTIILSPTFRSSVSVTFTFNGFISSIFIFPSIPVSTSTVGFSGGVVSTVIV